MLTKSAYEHIVIDDQGVPVIADKNTKVVEVVLDKLAHGWSAEEIHLQHPHLSLGEIHSALAYYWDHKEAIELDIEKRLRRIEKLRIESPTSTLVKRLRDEGLLD